MSETNPNDALVNHRIIVIDDNASIHEDYRKILVPPAPVSGLDDLESELFGTRPVTALERPHFALTSAMQGQEGHELVLAGLQTDTPFAMAFVDMRMPPGWDGMETTMHILAADPDIQIVICTAYSDYSWEDMAQRLGATDRVLILKKPFDNVEVTQLAMALCRKWTLARMARNRVQILETLVQERVKDLAASNARLSALIRVSPVGIFVIDRDGKVMSWNPAAERIFGWAAAEVIGHTLPNSMPAYMRVVMSTGEHIPITGDHHGTDLHVKRKDGVGIEVATYTAALGQPNGEVEGHIVVVADITARKQIESELRRAKIAAEAAATAKSEFLATMSHEIRTPMNGVMGMAELLLTTELDGEQRDFAQTIQTSGEALLAIINDILDFSKIEAGMMSLDPIPFDLPITVSGVVDLLAARAEVKGIELILRLAPDLAGNVIGDAGRIRQVLTNLIGNAVKFTLHGHVFVDVTRQSGDQTQQHVRFSISDTGIGIPSDKLNKLFQKFTQADSSTTRQFGGTGLGLAISKQLVELMNGQITVESEPGRGSTFIVDLPLLCDQQPAAGKSPILGELSGVQVLIADANPVVQRVLEEQVRSWGCLPLSVSFASEVLSTLRTQAVGGDNRIIILDAHLPDGDALELGIVIRATPGFHGVRLLLLTNVGQRGDSRRAVEAGFDAYLTKPINPTDLRDALATLISTPVGSPHQLVTRHSMAEARGHISSGSRRRNAVQAVIAQRVTPKVLVVEDNAINRRVVSRILESFGCEVAITTNGNEAVELCLTGEFSLVLMDYHLPGLLDGVNATRKIRAQERGRRVPIIAMSASVMDQDRELFKTCGMDGLIAKPIRSEEIEAALMRFVTGNATSTAKPAAPDIQ